MDAVRSFFTGSYAVDVPIEPSTSLRDDLWLDHLGLEDLAAHLATHAGVVIGPQQWDVIATVGDLLALCGGGAGGAPQAAPLPTVDEATLKVTFAMALDRFKSERQRAPGALPMVCFYHAGGMAASMRPFAAALDKVTGPVAVNPCWVELPGRGVRAKEALSDSVFDTAPAIARAVAVGLLGGDRQRPFLVFGHSNGTLHAFEVTRELQKLGFVPRALVVLSRQAPQIPFDRPEDNFTVNVSDEQFIHKMSAEYAQPVLLQMWKSNPTTVLASLPVTRADMNAFCSYRLPADAELLRAPIVAAVGSTDRPSNSEEAVRAWRHRSSHASFAFRLFQGGHFFYSDNYDEFMRWMWAQVSPLLSPR